MYLRPWRCHRLRCATDVDHCASKRHRSPLGQLAIYSQLVVVAVSAVALVRIGGSLEEDSTFEPVFTSVVGALILGFAVYWGMAISAGPKSKHMRLTDLSIFVKSGDPAESKQGLGRWVPAEDVDDLASAEATAIAASSQREGSPTHPEKKSKREVLTRSMSEVVQRQASSVRNEGLKMTRQYMGGDRLVRQVIQVTPFFEKGGLLTLACNCGRNMHDVYGDAELSTSMLSDRNATRQFNQRLKSAAGRTGSQKQMQSEGKQRRQQRKTQPPVAWSCPNC